MINTKKFYADCDRCIKYKRRENPASYTGILASKAVADIFVMFAQGYETIARDLAAYWIKNYIENSAAPDQEPNAAHIDWLANVLCFLDGEFDQGQDFPAADWREIRDVITAEAETLPIESLSAMMSILVSKNVL